MPHPTPRVLLGVALFALLAACAGETIVLHAPCPCATGWICCDSQVCARAGAVCPVDERAVDDPGEWLLLLEGVDTGACAASVDDDGDGRSEGSWSFDRSVPGRVAVLRGPDADGSIAADVAEVDARGRLTRYTRAAGDEYVWEYRGGWLASASFVSELVATRRDYTGLPDGTIVMERSEHGVVTARHRIRRDPSDGTERREIDEAASTGTLDDVAETVVTTTRDARGPVERRAEDRTGATSWRRTFRYDAAGRDTGYDEEGPSDAWRQSLRKIWDASGRLRRRELEHPVVRDGLTGRAVTTFEYRYDCPP